MEAAEIVEHARRMNITLTAEAGWITARPKGATPPDLAEDIRRYKAELLAHLRGDQEDREIDRLAAADGWKPLPPAGDPAYSIIATCLRHGVALRIDPETNDLIVGRDGAKAEEPTQPWPSLLVQIEVNLESVVLLVEAGWHLRAIFPAQLAT